MALTEQSVREFLASKTRLDLGKLGDDDALFSSGVIDSFVMIDLMTFLERHTGARLAPEDLEALDSVRAIVGFAAAKTKPGR
jgi:acyl carrier protein